MEDSREIVLAGKTYKIIVPLTLAQLIKCNIGMAPQPGDPNDDTELSYTRAARVISAACIAENPEVTTDFLLSLRGVTIREFNAATTICYEESGLIPKKAMGAAPDAGEAKAA